MHNVNVKCLKTTGIIVVWARPSIMERPLMVCCRGLFIFKWIHPLGYYPKDMAVGQHYKSVLIPTVLA